MALERMSCAIWLPMRVDVQYKPCDLAPVSSIGIRVEQAQISYQMLLVVAR